MADVVGQITFSHTFGLVDEGRAPNVFADIHATTKSLSWVGQLPWVYRYHERLVKPYIGDLLASGKRNGSLRNFTAQLVKARIAQGGDPSDMMAKFEAISKSKPDQFDGSDVLSACATNVVAGSDTTAISMRAVVYYVLKNPACQKRLVEEVDEHYAEQESGILSFDMANNMPFLQAVIYEAMRLHPVIAQMLPRVVPDGGMQCEGFGRIPAGTFIGTSPYALSRSTEVFGEDATSFRPERWMGPAKGELKRFWFPFGAGSRTCLGNNLAWMEMVKVLAGLFRTFDLRLADPLAEWELTSFVFLLQSNLDVVLTVREF
jgi:cytochrome P450